MNNVDLIKQNFELRKENSELKKENIYLKEKVKSTGNKLAFANNKIKKLEKQFEDYQNEEEKRIKIIVEKAVNKITEKLNKEHEIEINNLNAKINRLEKRLNTNSINSSIPTSKDRIGKHKIQNNREKTNNKIGSQDGHEIHKLEYFREEEITNTVEHTLDECPVCGGKLKEINVVRSDVIDVEIKVTKTRNNIHNYKCEHCKKNISANNDLPRGVTYGNNIKTIGLSMMNESNTPLNKITTFISGITNNEVNLTEGYLVKLQKQASSNLDNFKCDLKEKIISLEKVFWDDTTVKIGIGKPVEGYDDKDKEYLEKIKNDDEKKEKNIRNGIIRFYGDDRFALLIGHRTKKAEDIDKDGILDNLSSDCVVMHDHVLLNYNDKYNFKNAECNEHIRRYLRGNMDRFPSHTWSGQMRDFLIEIKKEKEELIKKGINSFTKERLNEIYSKYDEIITLGYQENKTVNIIYILDKNDELNLIERLDKFKENHLMFACDFSVDFTNNTSEKGLRQVKRKIAVSFMFKNANRMKDYANIISYLETCFRNNISRFNAIKRLVSNNPYTIKEIVEMNEKNE